MTQARTPFTPTRPKNKSAGKGALRLRSMAGIQVNLLEVQVTQASSTPGQASRLLVLWVWHGCDTAWQRRPTHMKATFHFRAQIRNLSRACVRQAIGHHRAFLSAGAGALWVPSSAAPGSSCSLPVAGGWGLVAAGGGCAAVMGAGLGKSHCLLAGANSEGCAQQTSKQASRVRRDAREQAADGLAVLGKITDA